MSIPPPELDAVSRSEPATHPERRTPPWGRRSNDKGWPAGGAALGCRIIELPRITDPRGNLTFVESGTQVPFEIARVVYLYDVPGGEVRGGHAHRELEQLIIAVAGSFDVVVDDGAQRERFSLNRSYYGLYVPPMIWREMDNFSSGSVGLVLASHVYDESDYYRDHDEFARASAAHPVPAVRGLDQP
jgi:dTDP-4-dehydrorhamnose 3,5-epimerase-like enzyme